MLWVVSHSQMSLEWNLLVTCGSVCGVVSSVTVSQSSLKWNLLVTWQCVWCGEQCHIVSCHLGETNLGMQKKERETSCWWHVALCVVWWVVSHSQSVVTLVKQTWECKRRSVKQAVGDVHVCRWRKRGRRMQQRVWRLPNFWKDLFAERSAHSTISLSLCFNGDLARTASKEYLSGYMRE